MVRVLNATNLPATVEQEGPSKLNLLNSTARAEQEGASKRFSLDTLSSMDLVRGNVWRSAWEQLFWKIWKTSVESLNAETAMKISVKKSCSKNLKILQENTCVGVSFEQGMKTCNFIKKRLRQICFLVKLINILRTPFLQNFSQLPLHYQSFHGKAHNKSLMNYI